MKKYSILGLILVNFLTSCIEDDATKNKSGEFKGDEVALHDGKAWTVVKVDNNGNPTEITITMNDGLLNSVPIGTSTGSAHQQENSVVLPFNNEVKTLTPFKYVVLDYNPDGHDPAAVYGLPHFDFHYYLMDDAERLAIPPYEVDSSKFVALPAQAYLPANYVSIPGGVPQMGTHWIDVTSPELSGQIFVETFIYGSYNGKVTFYEPMITLNFLKTTTGFDRDIPQPAKVQVSGYYPTKMEIRKHDGITDVKVTAFVYREAQ